MELPQAETSLPNRSQTNFQSIDDFMKEQDELDAKRSSDGAAHLLSNATKKQRKVLMQAERERLDAEKKLKKAALEAEKKCVEEQEREAFKALGVENWVGKLLEYRNAHPKATGGLTYAEEVVPQAKPRFLCRILIYESDQHFGGTLSFSNKKDAKKHASKKAIDWLIENNFMPTDGSVKFPKAAPPPIIKAIGAVTPSPTATPKPATTYAGQIPGLCNRLGFNIPMYEITKDMENAAFWSGYAHFGGDPRIEGKVGIVKAVFGKSNAKEQIAQEVLSFLKDIERQRMESEDDTEEERKRKRSLEGSDLGENSGKVVKVVA